jgi:hypothetical protein
MLKGVKSFFKYLKQFIILTIQFPRNKVGQLFENGHF